MARARTSCECRRREVVWTHRLGERVRREDWASADWAVLTKVN